MEELAEELQLADALAERRAEGGDADVVTEDEDLAPEAVP
jgi:hypothetical protein